MPPRPAFPNAPFVQDGDRPYFAKESKASEKIAENPASFIDKSFKTCYHILAHGDVAQLVERRVRNAQVEGSSPFISTIRELSEHHDNRKVGSDSFFIAEKSIISEIFAVSPKAIVAQCSQKSTKKILLKTSIILYHKPSGSDDLLGLCIMNTPR